MRQELRSADLPRLLSHLGRGVRKACGSVSAPAGVTCNRSCCTELISKVEEKSFGSGTSMGNSQTALSQRGASAAGGGKKYSPESLALDVRLS